MKFRTKFGALGYCWVGFACLMGVLWLSGPHKSYSGMFAFTCVLMASQQILNHFFIYWEVRDDHLLERRLWNAREVAWNEVTHVGNRERNPDYLVVDHVRMAPLSERGSILANPEDRSEFIHALHRRAPQAIFDV